MAQRPENDRSHLVDDAKDFAKDELLGGRHWKRSKLGYLTGASTFTDAGRSIASTGNLAKGRIERLYAYAFRREVGGVAVDPEIVDTREKFIAAMEANGKTIEDVNASVAVTYKQFWFYAFLMAACAVIGVASIAFGGFKLTDNLAMNLAFAFLRFSPLALLGVLALRAGWTNWAFRRRRLDGLDAYLRSGALLPKSGPPVATTKAAAPVKRQATPAPRGTPKASVAVLALAGLFAYTATLFLLTPALASPPATGSVNDIFTNSPSGDLFMQLLSYVMPGVGPIPDNQTTGTVGPYLPIKAGLAIFSGTLLFLGMAMAGWHILSGLVASAKEGTALGRNYHEVWAPARVVIGFGMLTPMIGGLCGAQILVLYFIAWGGNLANIVWKPYVAAVTFAADSGGSAAMATDIVTSNNQALGNSTTQALMEKYVCYYTVKKFGERGGTGARQANRMIPSTPPTEFKQTTTNYINIFSARYEVLDFGNACGTIEMEVKKASAPVKAASGDAKKFGTTSISTDTTFEDQTSAAIQQARKQAIQNMIPPIMKIAEQAAATYQPNQGTNGQYFAMDEGGANANNEQLIQTMQAARKGYVDTIVEKIQQQMSQSNVSGGGAQAKIAEMRQKATADGWASAGTFYLTISRMQGNLYSAAFGGINASPINLDKNGALSQQLLEHLAGTKDRPGSVTGFRTWWEANFPAISQGDKGATQAGANSVWDMVSNASLSVAQFFMHLDVNPLNPMQSMIDYGNFLMNAGIAMYAALSIAGGIGSFVGETASQAAAVPGVGNVAKLASAAFKGAASMIGMVSPLFTFAALGMIAAGAIHAYIIPLVPYILTTFFVASMLLLVVESLVAAPLWAFFHIRMDGQEFVDQVQKPGYMIAFNLIIRPVLMIFGLLLSYLTFGAMSWFVGATFMPAARGLAASTTVGPIGATILVIMLAYINLQLAIKSFQLVTQIPDRVTRWFGQGGDRLGEEDDTHRHTAFLAGQLTGKVEGMARGAGIAKASNKMPNKPTQRISPDNAAGSGEGGGGKKGAAASAETSDSSPKNLG